MQEHIVDVSAHVRVRCLQVWLMLVGTPNALPRTRLSRLFDHVLGALRDVASSCRKVAVQIVRQLLVSNPFAGQVRIRQTTQYFTRYFYCKILIVILLLFLFVTYSFLTLI